MSVMMGYGASQGSSSSDSSNAAGDLLVGYSSATGCADLNPHLTTHDSGIDMSPHDLDSHGSDSQDLNIIRTQEIEYQDISSSSEASHPSFSDNLSNSLDEYNVGATTEKNNSSKSCHKKSSSSSSTTGSSGIVERRSRRRRSPPKATFDFNDNSLVSVYTFFKTFLGASTASTVAIDNKIEQAMDLVKSHLMFAVREEVDVLKDRIGELLDRITILENENVVLRQHAPLEVLQQFGTQPPHQMQSPNNQQQQHHSSSTS